MTELSIVVPTFQNRDLVERCVRALMHQTLEGDVYEVIVVTGSTDGTLDVLREIHGPCRLRIERTANRGQAAALNRGIELAAGRFCLFVADDLLPAAHLAEEHLRAQRTAGGIAAFGRIDTVAGPRTDAMTRWTAEMLNGHYSRLGEQVRAPDALDVSAANLSVPTDLVRRLGGFATDLPAFFDVELGCRLADAGVAITYLAAAHAERTCTKAADELLGDAFRHGQNAIALVERRPETLERLPIAAFSARAPKELLALRILLALHVGPGLLRGLVPVLSGRGRNRAAAFYRLLDLHAFWCGVRDAPVDRETWASFTRPPVVLMYHSIGARREGATMYRVPARRFTWQLRYLRARGYRVLALDDVLTCRAASRLSPGRSVVITFDDGYRDNYTEALPRLRRRGLPATVFVVTNRMGSTNDWDETGELAGRPLLNWDEARTMSDAGISIASHTRSHPDLTELSHDEALDELANAREQLATELDRVGTAFAYPYGIFNTSVRELVEQAGYAGACTVRPGVAHPLSDPFELPRLTVAGVEGLLRFALAVELGHLPATIRSGRRPGRRPHDEFTHP